MYHAAGVYTMPEYLVVRYFLKFRLALFFWLGLVRLGDVSKGKDRLRWFYIVKDKFGLVWRGLERFGEVWRGLERFREVWRGLERFWTSLERLGKVRKG